MKKPTLTKPTPAWHAEALNIVRGNFPIIFSDLCSAAKRAVWMGIFFSYIKERGKADESIPHGQFLPWIHNNFPEFSKRTAQSWMRSGADILADADIQIGNFGQFEKRSLCIFAHDGNSGLMELWTAPVEKLPAAIREIRECIDAAIENKKKGRMLVISPVQVNEKDDDAERKRGRLPGEGGRPPELKGTIEEVATARRKTSWRASCKAADELEKVGIDFIAFDDGQNTKLLAAYERSVKCLRAWLNTPATKRDAKEIQKLWKTL
jgi:hypothetical protein